MEKKHPHNLDLQKEILQVVWFDLESKGNQGLICLIGL